jgi:PadR family transcriptional regulator, regulatory protein PadR
MNGIIATPAEVIMPEIPPRLFQGTLDTLILQSLTAEPRHGYAIASWLEQRSAAALTIEDAALYTALHRMEEQGWIDAEWGVSEKKKRAKFYRITPTGRRKLVARVSEWSAYVEAVDRILRPARLEAGLA